MIAIDSALDFGGALAEKPRQCNSSEKLLDNFLKEKHESQSKGIAMLLSSTTLRELFVKYNTAIPFSAAVERLFSLGKDVLKPKRSGLSDEHFEMLVFLKQLRFNKSLFLCCFYDSEAVAVVNVITVFYWYGGTSMKITFFYMTSI